MQREQLSTSFPLGSPLPNFRLPDTNGSEVDDSYLRGSPAALVVFTCNHCPYVKGSEASLIETVKRFAPHGLKTVAINSNNAREYPEDGVEKMREKAEGMALPYPYLRDESQEVARSFDAACTPECYLFNAAGRLVFHGTINNSPKDPRQATVSYLETAVQQLLQGKDPIPSFVHPMGCSIKWLPARC